MSRARASRQGVTIRPATPAEFGRIAELTVTAYRDDQQLPPGSPYQAVLADVAGRAAGGELLVAVDPDSAALLGSVLYVRSGSRFAELCGPDEAEFRTLAVAPTAQRRGVGEALVRACLRRAREQQRTAVVICSRDNADAAHRLYTRLGFRRIPEQDWNPQPGIRLLAFRYQLAGPTPAPEVGTGRSDDEGR
ncbi:GNAT family N-acetyltransferase [Natronosporangium hydrolyticum]|uniref:GNAT family N-acetyltransferase n=1 Tax=Natronosporangium hydrolyticum TaxID=2811111 RepID=A0A895YD03_9ACTN|nr:N-acetyltransferase [Natronosporangium hydrolyticum]QSB15694.1 GNAT family N-acetyltransferase [Natronosporangium hydrolyticum]